MYEATDEGVRTALRKVQDNTLIDRRFTTCISSNEINVRTGDSGVCPTTYQSKASYGETDGEASFHGNQTKSKSEGRNQRTSK